MSKILLDYVFPVSAINPAAAASTAFLKQVCIVVAPAEGVDPGEVTLCTSASAVTALTDNLDAAQLFAGGLSRVYVLPMDTLGLASILETEGSNFFTLLISSDFTDSDVTDDLDLGDWTGVVGVSSVTEAFLTAQAVITNRAAFHTTLDNKAKNMCYAFGKLLSNATNWKNQQYITLPFSDDVETLGDAENLFDLRINFAISDTEYGSRLGLFACGGQAIAAPYIKRNLEIDLQSKALTYISGNQPAYTKTQAALLEDELQKVIDGTAETLGYISRGWIEDGVVTVSLLDSNFVASGAINISEPKALWRIFAEISQTL